MPRAVGVAEPVIGHASTARELGFLLVIDSHSLAPYRQAALWLADAGVYTLSGLVQVEANSPYALWLAQVCRHLVAQEAGPTQALTAADAVIGSLSAAPANQPEAVLAA